MSSSESDIYMVINWGGYMQGKIIQVQQALHSALVMNPALWQAQGEVQSCSTAASQNLPSYDNFLVKKSIVAFATFQGQCQDTP